MRLPIPTALLLAAFLAAPAYAKTGESSESELEFARNGFYLGAGGVFLYPGDWDSDFESSFQGKASGIATTNAEAGLASSPATALDPAIVPVNLSGTHLDELWGAGAVLGWRISPYAALEFEGEWISDANESNFIIDSTGDVGKVKISDLWTTTANIRIYPLTGRIQPFGVVGVGLYHAKFETHGATVGNTTTGVAGNPPVVVDSSIPADFDYVQNKTKTDGALRAGVGIDVYVTPHVAAEAKIDYVIPFIETGLITTDYLSVRLGLLYRF